MQLIYFNAQIAVCMKHVIEGYSIVCLFDASCESHLNVTNTWFGFSSQACSYRPLCSDKGQDRLVTCLTYISFKVTERTNIKSHTQTYLANFQHTTQHKFKRDVTFTYVLSVLMLPTMVTNLYQVNNLMSGHERHPAYFLEGLTINSHIYQR